MIELPLKLIKSILYKHEHAVIEVMAEQVQQYNDLVDKVCSLTPYNHIDDALDYLKRLEAEHAGFMLSQSMEATK